jgi:hypothetical protein
MKKTRALSAVIGVHRRPEFDFSKLPSVAVRL